MQEAATRRTYVMAHCHTDESARRCVTLGVRSIEHGSDIQAATARLIAEKGAFVVPTLAVTDVLRKHGNELDLPPMSLHKIQSLYDRILRAIETCAQAGVKLGLGADLLGSRFHELQGMELPLRGEVSSPLEVLRSATSINGELLQRPGELGCIKAGARADLLVLDFDPSKELGPFARPEQSIALIMKEGRIVRTQSRVPSTIASDWPKCSNERRPADLREQRAFDRQGRTTEPTRCRRRDRSRAISKRSSIGIGFAFG